MRIYAATFCNIIIMSYKYSFRYNVESLLKQSLDHLLIKFYQIDKGYKTQSRITNKRYRLHEIVYSIIPCLIFGIDVKMHFKHIYSCILTNVRRWLEVV